MEELFGRGKRKRRNPRRDDPMTDPIADLVKTEVEKIIAYYKDAAQDGISLAEGWKLIQLAISTLTQLAEQLDGVTGSQKKAAVLAAVEELVDYLLDKWDIKAIPDMIEKLTVDPILKRIVMRFADGAVDAVVNVFDKTEGWLPKPAAPPADPEATPAPAEPSFPGVPEGWEPY
jgi:hypothetical protein